jgi:hypothetical protein
MEASSPRVAVMVSPAFGMGMWRPRKMGDTYEDVIIQLLDKVEKEEL